MLYGFCHNLASWDYGSNNTALVERAHYFQCIQPLVFRYCLPCRSGDPVFFASWCWYGRANLIRGKFSTRLQSFSLGVECRHRSIRVTLRIFSSNFASFPLSFIRKTRGNFALDVGKCDFCRVVIVSRMNNRDYVSSFDSASLGSSTNFAIMRRNTRLWQQELLHDGDKSCSINLISSLRI